MFDSYYESDTKYVPYNKNVYVDVTENRAPTDDSARLLKELQEKAESEIFKTFELKDNIVSAAVIYKTPDFLERSLYSVRYILNGKEYTAKGKIDFRYIDSKYPLGSKEAMTSLFESISENLVRELMVQALQDGDLR